MQQTKLAGILQPPRYGLLRDDNQYYNTCSNDRIDEEQFVQAVAKQVRWSSRAAVTEVPEPAEEACRSRNTGGVERVGFFMKLAPPAGKTLKLTALYSIPGCGDMSLTDIGVMEDLPQFQADRKANSKLER